MSDKPLSVRVPPKLAKELEAIARAEGVKLSEAIRAALYRYIAACRSDPEFKKRLKQRMEEDHKLLEHLAGDS